jgi:hypothetical protein
VCELVHISLKKVAVAQLSEQLLFFLTSHRERVRAILRPPWAAFPELSPTTPHETAPPRERRDPRVARDQMHDMRMPPYMRDSDATALSITRRQYDTIMAAADRFSGGAVAGRSANPGRRRSGAAGHAGGNVAAAAAG